MRSNNGYQTGKAFFVCVIALSLKRYIVVNLYQWSGDNSAAASLYVEVSILYSAG